VKQSVSLITLGVSHYERAKSFYAVLGCSPALKIREPAFFQGRETPVSRLRSGPIWLEEDILAWAQGSPVERGRPPKVPRRRRRF
jgi:hypothetical protein